MIDPEFEKKMTSRFYLRRLGKAMLNKSNRIDRTDKILTQKSKSINILL